MCSNKWSPGCKIKGTPGACGTCQIKKTIAVDELVVHKHMSGTARMGIYPGLPDKMVQFVVADIDGHQPGQDAKTDTKTILRVASDMSIPIMAFSLSLIHI